MRSMIGVAALVLAAAPAKLAKQQEHAFPGNARIVVISASGDRVAAAFASEKPDPAMHQIRVLDLATRKVILEKPLKVITDNGYDLTTPFADHSVLQFVDGDAALLA